VERLLSIIGEDTMSVPRKHMDDWIGKLSTRFLMLTNETPQLSDASGAIASRFIVLTLTETFIGKEDIGLLEKFAPELPGILIWALDGLDRLTKRKKFIQPESSADVIEEFEDLGSPVAAFVREKCEIGPKFEVKCSEIFDEWKKWCEANGRNHPGFAHLFGRNLHTVVPKLGKPKKNNVDRKYLGIRVKF
jgi:putative DNA primase/helicase